MNNLFTYHAYSRWLEDKGRRETWDETVRRLVDYYGKATNWAGTIGDWDDIYQAIYNLEVLPVCGH